MMPDTKTEQPTLAPTRKLFWGAVTGVITSAVLNWTDNLAGLSPDWFGFVSDGDFKTFVPVIVGGLVAYMVKDRQN